MAVMKLHGNARSSATIRALASIYEKGIDFEFVPVNMAAGDHKKEAFISLNPFGQVPALEDEDLKLFGQLPNIYIAHKYAKEGNQLIYKDPKKMATLCVWVAVELVFVCGWLWNLTNLVEGPHHENLIYLKPKEVY